MKVLTGKLDELRRDLRVLQPAEQRRRLCALARPVEPFDNDESTAFWHGKFLKSVGGGGRGQTRVLDEARLRAAPSLSVLPSLHHPARDWLMNIWESFETSILSLNCPQQFQSIMWRVDRE